MTTATLVSSYGAGTTWYSGGTTYETVTPSTDFPAAQIGDVLLHVVERDHTALPFTHVAAPAGWTAGALADQGAHRHGMYWMRITDLTVSSSFVCPVDSDTSWWSGCVRSTVDPVFWSASGGGNAYSGTPADQRGVVVCSLGEISNTPASVANTGYTRVFYSPTIQWEANLGIFVSDDDIPPNTPTINPMTFGGGFVPNKARAGFFVPVGWRVGSIGF